MGENDKHAINFEKICRLCLYEKRTLTEIFESTADNNNLSIDQKIMACATIDLCKGDGLPSRICVKCLSSVNAAFEFRMQCENADKTLHELHSLISKKTEMEIQSQNEEINKIKNEMIEDLQDDKDQEEENNVDIDVNVYEKNLEENIILIDRNAEVPEDELMEEEDAGELYYLVGNEDEGDEDSLGKTCENKPVNEECRQFKEKSGTVKMYKVIVGQDDKAEYLSKLKDVKSEDGQKSECPFCHKILSRVEEHIRLLHRNKIYVCTNHNCGAEFLTLKNLQSHQLNCLDLEKEYKCQYCSKEFHRKSNYKNHVKRHEDKKEFKCQICNKAYVDSTGLRRHFLKHHEPEQEIFVSICCGKRFRSKEGLRKHVTNRVCGVEVVGFINQENKLVEDEMINYAEQ